MKKHSLWYRIKRAVIFFFGDVRRLSHFPWVTWDVYYKSVDYTEAMDALGCVKAGDVGIHRDDGYFSNLVIPGFFKHAWIHLNDGKTKAEIMEAVSEGVLRRHALHSIVSDYTVILRPPEGTVTAADVSLAVGYAEKLEGCEYDVDFNFNIEKEHADLGKHTVSTENCSFRETDASLAVAHRTLMAFSPPEERAFLGEAKDNLQQKFGAFSCTEVASFCWWHKRRELKIRRKRYGGKEIIAADDFLNGFDIVWASKKVTPEAAKKFGLSNEAIRKIKAWREAHDKPKI
ncbi:MAG: hypothetical protein Q8K86_05770 [Candidatus Nanopelagicaceae bacterium]|nr:hypothetical protein [Candidatus Nanopelagicaceae bacterium]